MSIPLDRLYDFVRDVCNQDVIIYRFYPHGSKNLADSAPTKLFSWQDNMRLPHALCHDQECIDLNRFPLHTRSWIYDNKWYESPVPFPWFKNQTRYPFQLYNHIILVHSERNSQAIAQTVDSGYLPVHWLCHAMISQEWFRYAKHDPVLATMPIDTPYRFLIYNRAWCGSREYRLKFAELLVNNDLVHDCVTSVSFRDQNVYYKDHKFANPTFTTNIDLEQFFTLNQTTSDYSADYDHDDYLQTAVEIVLETWFDCDKNHLTEKTFRPLAVGKPFILVSSAHSLDYVKSYGFRTFHPWIDETYDTIQDSSARLQAVITEMCRLQSLPKSQFADTMMRCRIIAEENKKRFFSQSFTTQVVGELADGMRGAISFARSRAGLDNFRLWAANQSIVPDITAIAQELNLA